MTVLIDTGVFYADHDLDATRHEAAERALTAVFDGEYGQPYLTDYIFDEAVTVTLARTGSHDAAVSLGHRLRGVGQYPPVYELLRVDHATFDDALDVSRRTRTRASVSRMRHRSPSANGPDSIGSSASMTISMGCSNGSIRRRSRSQGFRYGDRLAGHPRSFDSRFKRDVRTALALRISLS